MKEEPIAFVVKTVTGVQLSCRFGIRMHARRFADECASPVRIWRIVWKRPRPRKCTVQGPSCAGCEACA